MRSNSDMIRQKAAGAALAMFAGAAACGVEAVRVHMWQASLGPICGLDRPALFFMHCPACPAGLGFLALAAVFAALAGCPAAKARASA